MYKVKAGMFLNVLTPMHVGGSYELGIVDQPIQREGHTGFPKIEASSLKGSLRHTMYSKVKNEAFIDELFGSEDTKKGIASSVAFSDARVLFFPVRSAKGVFAYVTCPMVLYRFYNDMKRIGINYEDAIDFSQIPLIVPESKIDLDSNHVVLEEYTFKGVHTSPQFQKLLEKISESLKLDARSKEMLIKHAVIISDDAFADFVHLSTEIVTRIRISHETGIVKDGALFNEEYLPSETILYSILFIADGYKKENMEPKSALTIFRELETYIPNVFQVGGNATLGKGFIECKLIGGDKDASRNQ